ncbi:hypothetical protein SEA_BARNSTORMER_17 [Microbacterium phage Barnstormer]|uniref:Uncharacterized protein n=1 Tax=Microbacterium phage Barnstormer TaxID=3028491 RepID=A0AAE9ZSQ7_9CAUD|nr:hypothetical protein SEA_BARNSTORMER_17 [Microbacterium phage Barnstormer]WDS52123.1 hypothetical protein SEA_UTZCHIPS_17 [Microbacterium phage UtzChips]
MAIEVRESTVTTHITTYTEDASDGSKMAAVLRDEGVELTVMGATYTLPVADVATLAALLSAVAASTSSPAE